VSTYLALTANFLSHTLILAVKHLVIVVGRRTNAEKSRTLVGEARQSHFVAIVEHHRLFFRCAFHPVLKVNAGMMLASGGRASTRSRRSARSLYVCPECDAREVIATVFGLPSTASVRASRQRRHLGTSKPRNAAVDPARSATVGFQFDNVVSGAYANEPSSKSAIRAHLRAWASENNKKNEQDIAAAKGDTDKLFKLINRQVALPNSLFVEEANISTGADEDAQDDDYEQLSQSDPGVEGERVYDAFAVYHDLDPGDMIWWLPCSRTTFARAQLAIYLGTAGYQRQFVLGDGRWILEKPMVQHSPVYKQVLPLGEVDKLRQHIPNKPLESQSKEFDVSTPHSLGGDIPTQFVRPAISSIARFADEMSTWRRENLEMIDSMYERIANEEQYLALPFDEAVERATGVECSALPPAALFVLYRTLLRSHKSVICLTKRPWHTSALVCIVPKKLAQDFNKVCTWAREYQESAAGAATGRDVSTDLNSNPLTLFVAKARRLILKSRMTRSPTTIGSLGPSSAKAEFVEGNVLTTTNDETFDANDRIIINFLWDCYVRIPKPETNRNTAIGSLILRAIGAYPKIRLDESMGRLLLQEIGALSPWYSGVDHDIAHEMPHGRVSEGLKKAYNDAFDFINDTAINRGGTIWSCHSSLPDSMIGVREDLGSLPVYCIDPGQTRIKEDGHSVEPHPDIPNAYWLHAHQIDPTAFFDKDHILGQRARKLLVPRFHHNKIARLFPDRFCMALTLAPNAPALTMSTLIRTDGKVLDVKCRSTLVRNVVYLKMGAVEAILGRPEYEAATLTLGKSGKEHNVGLTLEPPSPEHVEAARPYLPDLELMEKLVEARFAYRRANLKTAPPNWEVGGVMSHQMYHFVWGTEHNDDHMYQSRQYIGDPSIKLKVSRYIRTNRVSEMHKNLTLTALLSDLTGESAGKWFGDRKIPGVFFGSSYEPGYTAEKLNNLKPGERANFPTGRLSSTPIEHIHKCQKAHLLFSSPLRRYNDLIGHWNANAYLRAEAEGRVKPGQSAENLDLPFSQEEIKAWMRFESPKMIEHAETVSASARRHWISQALFRAFHFKEAKLPDIWDVQINGLINRSKMIPEDTGLKGLFLPFQQYACILASPEGYEKGARMGQFLPCRLELVDSTHCRVWVRPVGPPSDDFTQQGPIHIGTENEEPQLKDVMLEDRDDVRPGGSILKI
jgi:hypothetical protein